MNELQQGVWFIVEMCNKLLLSHVKQFPPNFITRLWSNNEGFKEVKLSIVCFSLRFALPTAHLP